MKVGIRKIDNHQLTNKKLLEANNVDHSKH